MKKRIFSFMCLTAFAAIVLTSCLIVWVTYHEYETRMKNEVRMETGYIMEALSLGGRAYLGRISGTDKRITLIDGSGVVLFDNRANPATMENHLERPEIRSALENGQGEAERVSDTLSEKTYYYALRLQDGSILRVAYTNDTLLSSVSSLLPYIALVCLVILLFLVAMARILTGRIVSPLNTLDLDHPESNSIYDELSPLLSKIHRQNAEIKKQMDLLCEKQQEFSAITENMSEGFLVVDRNIRTSCPTTAERLSYLTPVSLRKKTAFSL
jgi:two-component system phosphate regulon sensor histidine kinase PhoR